MTRRKRDDEQPPLPLAGTKWPIGRVEQAVGRSLRTAQRAGELDTIHAGAAALARALARGVDEAEAKRDQYARAACSRELREVLASLGLNRESRGELPRGTDTGGDAFDSWLRSLDAPTSGDAPQP